MRVYMLVTVYVLMCVHIQSSTGYDCCGTAESEDDLAALRADTGTLAEKRWQELSWEMPNDEGCSCWWVATADGTIIPVLG